jgi:predicted CXXCH cytochrome family protein
MPAHSAAGRQPWRTLLRGRRGLLVAGLCGAVALVGLGSLRAFRHKVPAAPGDTPAGTLPSAPPDLAYLGDAACAECHPTETETYRQHPMGRSFSRVPGSKVERYEAAAGNPFTEVGLHFQVEQRNGQVFHREWCQDPEGRTVFDSEAPIQFAIGSGTRGRSYVVNRKGYLFQSPIGWYSEKGVWDLSPGFAADYESARPVGAACLFCHANRFEACAGTVNRFRTLPDAPIGCERCHGPGSLHVARRSDGGAIEGADETIVNPSRLRSELREAVCEQCHLQGEVRILRAGRQLFDYRPGLPLQAFWTVFTRPAELTDDNRAVGHVEQMATSRCFRESNGRFGCTSCHDPHAVPAPAARAAFYRERCLRCHGPANPTRALAQPDLRAVSARSCRAPAAERQRTSPPDSCIACHMPRFATSNIAHAAATDHRVPRRPGVQTRAETLSNARRPLVPFHKAPNGDQAGAMARAAGLALVELAEPMSPDPSRTAFARMALPLLRDAVATKRDDVSAWQGLGFALWVLGQKEEGLAALETAIKVTPEEEMSLRYAAELSASLGRHEQAIAYWRRALAVDPYAWRAHRELAKLLADRRDWNGAIAELQKALALSPARPDVRLLLALCWLESGKKEEARAELARARALGQPGPEDLRRWLEGALGR